MAERTPPSIQATTPQTTGSRGVYLVPDVAQESAYMRVVIQVTRDRTNKSLNTKWAEDRSHYGYAQAIINGRVSQESAISYGKNQVFFYDNRVAEVMAQIHCSTLNINNNLETLYAGITGGVPSPVYPAINWNPIQPPFLPRVPLDEVWVQVEGGAIIACWCEYMPLDYLCDTARDRFIPRDRDKENDQGLPNPTGQGNQGNPENPGPAERDPMAPDGNGDGDIGPFDIPGKLYGYFVVTRYGTPSGQVVTSGTQFGPYGSPPTTALGPNENQPPYYSTRRYINGVDTGLAESYGFPTVLSVIRREYTVG